MTSTPRRAQLVGTGLIGGSIGLALRRQGWFVTGSDRDASRAERALELGAIDAVGDDPKAAVSFIAVPVSAIAEAARSELAKGGIVTDVGSVKAPVVGAVARQHFGEQCDDAFGDVRRFVDVDGGGAAERTHFTHEG